MRITEVLSNGKCPEGYEYVKGYMKKGKHVKPFCRKIKKMVARVKVKMEYPGKTTVKGTLRNGFHVDRVSATVDTHEIMEEGNVLALPKPKRMNKKKK